LASVFLLFTRVNTLGALAFFVMRRAERVTYEAASTPCKQTIDPGG
jgi:hypothetical protein